MKMHLPFVVWGSMNPCPNHSCNTSDKSLTMCLRVCICNRTSGANSAACFFVLLQSSRKRAPRLRIFVHVLFNLADLNSQVRRPEENLELFNCAILPGAATLTAATTPNPSTPPGSVALPIDGVDQVCQPGRCCCISTMPLHCLTV